MKIEIKCLAKVVNSKKNGSISEGALIEIGKLEHLNANISDFFNPKLNDITVTGGEIRFHYDRIEEKLYTIASYDLDKVPNEEQISKIVLASNEQIDLGFYGEDGWFVDLEQESFYILLFDKEINTHPTSIKLLN